MKEKKLYKIIVDGKSCHGGNMKWSLPKGEKPGKWHTVKGDLAICEKGLHVTAEPFKWYKWGCTAYEVETKDIIEWEDDKCVARSVRLLREVPHPAWWNNTVSWVETLKDIVWLKPDGKPNKEWKLFPTKAAAWDAATAAAGDAARDAALYARGIIIADLKNETKHRIHIKARMEVWQKGYGLLCDVRGILYVYEKI